MNRLKIVLLSVSVFALATARVAAEPPRIYAQALVDFVAASHPEFQKISIHAYAPDAAVATSCIIAAKDVTKPGDPDDDEDFAVITTAKPNFYRDAKANVYKGLLPLEDAAGQPVGSLTLSRAYTTAADEPAFAEAMTAVRDLLKVHVPTKAALYETGRQVLGNYAQALTDAILAAHPKLVRISLHVAAPGASLVNTYVIAGKDLLPTRLPMVGAVDDGEDFLPLTSGKPSFFFVEKRGFYKGILPLNDMQGRAIGVLMLGYREVTKADEAALQDEMTVIRNVLQVHIPSREALFRDDPSATLVGAPDNPAAAAALKPKNWAAPQRKIFAQALVDEAMASHPELLSLTLHGVPPGTSVHTMFAGSFPDRIGNADDPDDIDIQDKAETVLDPRVDRKGRFIVMLPLLDGAGEKIGALVIGYHKDEANPFADAEFYQKALQLRGDFAKRIPNLAALFAPLN